MTSADDFPKTTAGSGRPRRIRRNRQRLAGYVLFVLLISVAFAAGLARISPFYGAVTGSLVLAGSIGLVLSFDHTYYGRHTAHVQIRGMLSGRLILSLRTHGLPYAVIRSMHWTLVLDGQPTHCRTIPAVYGALRASPSEWQESSPLVIDAGERLTLLDVPGSALAKVSQILVHLEYDTPYDDRYALDAFVPEAALPDAA